MPEHYLYVLSVNGLLLLISIIFNYFPPKKINRFYGYRTHKSMLNQDIWDSANRVFNKTLISYALASFIVALLLAYLNPEMMTSWVPMALLFFTVIVCIYKTEQEIKQHFDDEGKRK
ncbi:SdpI family protein [Flavobacteriaceae bacterium S356]|uniref:SdpI family protein n=1 Tax=Asprobacillus argus TaxID=3076534 RepID=A0ABU3LCW6_9FLAO|nr:SdpI family protein [Flavobacteriaceae bacterium S356]